jgi:hypothetical protein
MDKSWVVPTEFEKHIGFEVLIGTIDIVYVGQKNLDLDPGRALLWAGPPDIRKCR